MGIKLFDIQNGVVTPTEHCYTISCLKRIMDEYSEDHLSIYAYLFYSSCYVEEENPFANMPEDIKEEEILKQVGGDFSPDEKAVFEALDFCKKAFSTPTQELYLSAKIGVERMSSYIRNSMISIGRDGNEMAYLKYLEKFDQVCKSFDARWKAFKDEQSSQSRGGNQIAYDQS